MTIYTCLICKNNFKRTVFGKYCSKKCYGKSLEKNHNLICVVCGNKFWARRITVKYCNHRCYGKSLEGKPSGRKGFKHTEEAKRKNSEAHRGERSNFWKGGRTNLDRLIRRSFKYKEWRTAIFKRDNYICIRCKVPKKYLNADHIKQFALIIFENKIKSVEEAYKCQELWELNNGRTLCVDCHKLTDTYFNKGRHYAIERSTFGKSLSTLPPRNST